MVFVKKTRLLSYRSTEHTFLDSQENASAVVSERYFGLPCIHVWFKDGSVLRHNQPLGAQGVIKPRKPQTMDHRGRR